MDKVKILFVENDAAFLKTRRWLLEAEGYEVLSANSFHKAQQLLKDAWVHVIIVDVRLNSNGEPSDKSGIMLIRETDPVIPKIVLTAFPDWKNAQSGLLPGHAVYFLAKQDGEAAMFALLRRVLDENVRINPLLDIRFTQEFSLLLLVNALDRSLSCCETISRRITEIEDLLQKVFFDYTRVTLHNLSNRAGGILRMTVKAVSNRGEERFIVRCGERKDISVAIQTLDQRPIYSAETLHYAAVAYKMSFWQKAQQAFSGGGGGFDFLDKLITLLNKIIR